jgi:hypothetical protein
VVNARRSKPGLSGTKRPTAKTPDERENQLINAAVDLAARQIEDGTASAQVITHFLKLGSSRERKEQSRLDNEIALLETKRENMESERRTEALMREALDAMKRYSGASEPQPEPEYDEYEM